MRLCGAVPSWQNKMIDTRKFLTSEIARIVMNGHEFRDACSLSDRINRLRCLAETVLKAEYRWFSTVEKAVGPIEYQHVEPSLRAILESLTSPDLLEAAVEELSVNAIPSVLTGHVLAANTPLLGWSSILRSIIVGTPSIVKLSSRKPDVMSQLLMRLLESEYTEAASTVSLIMWERSNAPLLDCLLNSCETVAIYGNDETQRTITNRAPKATKLLHYGNRLSISIVDPEICSNSDYESIASDVLLADQLGCLSCKYIFVRSSGENLTQFSKVLSRQLSALSVKLPRLSRELEGRAEIIEQCQLASMSETHQAIVGRNADNAIVINHSKQLNFCSASRVVSVVPFESYRDLLPATRLLAGLVQGISTNAVAPVDFVQVRSVAIALEASWLCKIGHLQRPPLYWPDDGIPAFASLTSSYNGSRSDLLVQSLLLQQPRSVPANRYQP